MVLEPVQKVFRNSTDEKKGPSYAIPNRLCYLHPSPHRHAQKRSMHRTLRNGSLNVQVGRDVGHRYLCFPCPDISIPHDRGTATRPLIGLDV